MSKISAPVYTIRHAGSGMADRAINVIKRIVFRNVLLGLLVGIGGPVISVAWAMQKLNLVWSFESFVFVHQSIWFLFGLNVSLILLGAFFFFNGFRKGRIVGLTQFMESEVAERTSHLNAINHKLKQDVLEGKRVANFLQESRGVMEQRFRSTPHAIFIVDIRGTILDVNDKVTELTGYESYEVIGKTYRLFKMQDQTGKPEDFLSSSPHPQEEIDCKIQRKNGEILAVTKNVNILRNDSGKIIGTVESFFKSTASGRAYTELREARDELEKTSHERNKAREAIEEKQKELSKLKEELKLAKKLAQRSKKGDSSLNDEVEYLQKQLNKSKVSEGQISNERDLVQDVLAETEMELGRAFAELSQVKETLDKALKDKAKLERAGQSMQEEIDLVRSQQVVSGEVGDDEAKRVMDFLEQKVRHLQEDLVIARRSLEEADKQRNELVAELGRTRGELEVVREDLQDKSREAVPGTEQQAVAQSELDAAVLKIEEIERDRSGLKKDLDRVRMERDAIRLQVEGNTQKLSQLKQAVQVASKELETRVAESAQYKELVRQEQLGKASALEELARLKRELEHERLQRQRMSLDQDTSEVAVKRLSGEMEALQQRLQDSKHSRSLLKDELSGMRAELEKMRGQVDAARRREKKSEDSLYGAMEKLSSLSGEWKTAKEEAELAESEKEKAQKSFSTTMEELGRVQLELDTALDLKQQFESDKAALDGKAKGAMEELSQARAELSELKKKSEKVLQEKDTLAAALMETIAELGFIQDELNDARGQAQQVLPVASPASGKAIPAILESEQSQKIDVPDEKEIAEEIRPLALPLGEGPLKDIKLEEVPFNLHKTLDEIALAHKEAAGVEVLDFVVKYDPKSPQRFLGDPDLISQIMNSLVGNAIKFTSEGHIQIDVACEEKTDLEARLRIEVADTGKGIHWDQVNQVFAKSKQSLPAQLEGGGKSDPSLKTTKQIVELLNGNMGVRSKRGQGSTFYFTVTLPIDNIRNRIMRTLGTAPQSVLPPIRMQ